METTKILSGRQSDDEYGCDGGDTAAKRARQQTSLQHLRESLPNQSFTLKLSPSAYTIKSAQRHISK